MKNILIIFFIFISLFVQFNAQAISDDIGDGMQKKAIRGAVNLVTGIVEIPMQVYKGYDSGFRPLGDGIWSKVVGTALGIFRGFGHAAGRMSWGALELIGFWSANHLDNDGVGIPLDSEYAWDMGQQYSIFDPSFSEGIKPVGYKIKRGLMDSFLGVIEIPGQAMRGTSEGSFLKGLGRGVWFWASREVYGLGSLFSCIVPNPKDNPGYSFSGVNPWSALSQELRNR